MQTLAAICVRRPVFATVLILVLVVFGLFGYSKLGVDRLPKIDIPVITVTTVLAGSSPEEVETEITDKIEEAVNTVSGIDELRSASVEGISQVYVSFDLDKDVDVAAQEVRDKVNGVLADLPQGIDQPRVEKLATDAVPVMTIALSGPFPVRDLTEYADKTLRRRIESVSGVGQVQLVGGQKRQINVLLDPYKLKSANLTVTDVARALQTQNIQLPGGSIKQGERDFTLRTMGRVPSVKQLNLISIANHNSHTITIGDVGKVEDGVEESKSLAQLNDEPTVLMNVRKQSGTNTVEVVHNVKERLDQLKTTIPANYRVDVLRDQSVYIEAATNTVKEHLILGAFLAAIVVFLFLANPRTTIIAAFAIPISIIGTFAIMKMMGFTLNMLTLLALTLSVGIVIDDAIVVLENIFRYIEEKNYKPYDAALAATREIGLAVLTITLSLVAVFLPIAFMSGIVGRFMSSFGITMAAAIMISMLVSFSLTPMLASRWLRKPFARENDPDVDTVITEEHSMEDIEREKAHASSKQRGFYHWAETTYLAVLRFSLRRRWLVVLIMFAALLSIPILFKRVPKNFMADDDESQFQVNVRTPEGTSLESTQLTLARIARDIRRLNGVDLTIANAADTDQHIANSGSIYVHLTDVSTRDFNQQQLMSYIRKELLPKYEKEKLRISVSRVEILSGGGNAAAEIQYVVAGPDMKKLTDYSAQIAGKLKNIPGTVDVDSSLVVGKPEYGITVDRAKAADLGVSIQDVAMTLRLLIAGDKVSDFNDAGEQYEIHVRALPQRRNSIADLSMVTVPSMKLGSVSLADIVKVSDEVGPSQIDRLNRRRQVTITANMVPGASQQAILDGLAAAVKDMKMGPEYAVALTGRSKELGKATNAFAVTFLMAFVFIYLVLAAQFESWIHPITILISLPLTVPFALLSLLIFGESLNIFSTLGMLVLFAVVKKNSILVVDHTNQLRAAGLPRFDAIVAANRDRLRPILMTTIAFVAGMLPLLISKGTGSATNRTISSIVVGGQTMSLALTLIATPIVYSLFDDLTHARIWRWLASLPAAVLAFASALIGRRARD